MFLDFFQRLLNRFRLTDDTLLSALFAGLFVGAGVGLVLRMGASSGGMDIPPLVLNKRTGISVSVFFLYAFDTVILLSQAFFSDLEKILYSILVTLLTSLIINKVMLIGKSQVQVMIISEKYQEINNVIQTSLTEDLLFAVHYWSPSERTIDCFKYPLPTELPNLNRLISQIDPDGLYDCYPSQ